MEKIYADSEEKYLKAVVLYGILAMGDDTTGLFYDAEGTKQAYDDDYDWEELFLKGLIRVKVGSQIPGQEQRFTITNPILINPIGSKMILFGNQDLEFAFFTRSEENADSSSDDMIPADHGNLNN